MQRRDAGKHRAGPGVIRFVIASEAIQGGLRLLVRRRMQPVGVARRLLGPAPFVEHQRRDAAPFGILRVGADCAGQFVAVAVGDEEIGRLEDAMYRGPGLAAESRGGYGWW